jgi:hypothetical protein
MPKKAYVEGILGIYEMNRIDLYRDVFVHAYAQSAKKYIAIKKEQKAKDPIKLKYRHELISLVSHIITNKIYPYDIELIEEMTNKTCAIEGSGFDMFVGTVIEEVKGLRESALFKYKLRPSDLVEWENVIKNYHQKS